MESKLKPSELMAISVLLALLSLQNWANATPQVPCYFIFGDSLSDSGNNNKLLTSAKVNYPPYGFDFPQGPTGRFTDGRTIHDFIVKRLGFKDYMPPFADSEGKNILNGVNYASGAAGILDATGYHRGGRIPFNEQIKNHKIIISRITDLMRNDSATKLHLSRCIYSVQIGSNDYINNYFKSALYHSGRRYTTQEFANVLIEQFSVQLKTLYDTGARKFAVYGLGLIGCTPDALSVYRPDGMPCVQKLNDGATPFNERLKPLLDEFNRNLTDAKFTYLNPSGNPAGLVTNSSCCQTGGGDGELCHPNSKPCRNPRQYLFWDGAHPTEVWNEMIAKSAYDSEKPEEANPFNIRKLAMQVMPLSFEKHRL
ncbi:GDSL-like Lipase/Acylhydrolase superfamily protein, putative isoform 2 [Hibiscus syriacus]|uniref:GDSL-like Lipase/Acylhydrolase superfamily protein, putative isoform 2 n=1 Tax=Hibiscus syriacus TaxID=106335 RepID=A0A6A2XZG0_HIBSY|nr:GDSL esterase/lipase At5g45670-like [Hibiscus syriacus]KAE8660284.1 GDSL-like Lipase/Acylhydrolase superfamily protein, putative isoform 2 [Hibiscus syriacus]